MNEKIHYIYKITNTVTNKFYVGMHTTSNIDDGYFGSGTILKRSIAKYGKECHTKEILFFLSNRNQLVEMEKQLVTEELISNPLCMNIRLGGEGGGGWTKEQQVLNNIKSVRKQKLLRETDLVWRECLSKKRSEGLKRSYENGIRSINPPIWNGKKHKESTKKKISLSKKGKCAGQNNSQFGTCWIYHPKDLTNKKIKKYNLDYWLNLGWLKGRKL